MTDKKQLGKREEVRALKEATRANIEALRVKIHTFLMTKQKIPDHIVNGTHSQIVNFKEIAEIAGDIYHVHSKPARRMTVTQLEVVELRLKEIAVKLGIDSI